MDFNLNGEIYRQTFNEEYFVTKTGKVAKIIFENNELKKFFRMRGEKVRSGHLRVQIGKLHYPIHRLVYAAWGEEELRSDLVIDHIDADPTNNNIENLRQVTQKENIRNAISHGNFGQNRCCKIKVFNKETEETKIYESIKSFLIDIDAPEYIIRHNSLTGLEKRTEYKKYHVVKLDELGENQTTIEMTA